VVFAATGTFLSFFHQGSLGGLYGVMFARPFAFRAGFFIWPWTFFLFIASAIASGPALTILVCKMVQGVSRKQLVRREAISLLAKVSGYLLTFYLIFKFLDTWWWATQTAPRMGMSFTEFFQGPYGMWLLVAELGICGVLPAIILLIPKAREDDVLLIVACVLNCTGIVINRFVFTVQNLALPVLPFEQLQIYVPTWQEWAPTVGVLAYGALLLSLSYRYLPMFPRERELNPID